MFDTTRVDPPRTGSERELLVSFLDFQRATFRLKCAGLTDEQLATRAVEPAKLSLLGLVRHLTDVENGWFAKFGDRPHQRRYYDEETNPDGDFDDVDPAAAADDIAVYLAECDLSRAAVAARDLDDTMSNRRGVEHSLRWVLLHMLEEYARHNGHADLLRERLDGTTGE